MLAEIREFLADIWSEWVTLMTGIASLILALIPAIFPIPNEWASRGIWIAAVVCFLICSFRVWRKSYRAKQDILKTLETKLRIEGVERAGSDTYRVVVRNLSMKVIRFRTSLVEIRPSIDHPLPIILQPTHADAMSDIAEVAGGGAHRVGVFTDHGRTGSLELRAAHLPPSSVMIQRGGRYEFQLCVYPVVTNGEPSIAAYRWVYIVPQLDGGIIFTANGEAELPIRESETSG